MNLSVPQDGLFHLTRWIYLSHETDYSVSWDEINNAQRKAAFSQERIIFARKSVIHMKTTLLVVGRTVEHEAQDEHRKQTACFYYRRTVWFLPQSLWSGTRETIPFTHDLFPPDDQAHLCGTVIPGHDNTERRAVSSRINGPSFPVIQSPAIEPGFREYCFL